jgi:hypothetical protein
MTNKNCESGEYNVSLVMYVRYDNDENDGILSS